MCVFERVNCRSGLYLSVVYRIIIELQLTRRRNATKMGTDARAMSGSGLVDLRGFHLLPISDRNRLFMAIVSSLPPAQCRTYRYISRVHSPRTLHHWPIKVSLTLETAPCTYATSLVILRKI